MKYLSTRRRHPAAKPLILVLALFLVGAVYALVIPSSQVSAAPGLSQQVQEGKALFQVSCSSCHGLNGEGTSQGPSLVGVGAASVDFQMGTGRMPMARPGQQAPRKDSEFSPEEISAISSYVATLGPGPGIPAASVVDPSKLTDEELARGGDLFKTNCSACHNVSGQGGALPNGKYAPPLTGVQPVHIYEAMRIGPQQMPVFSKNVITDEDATQIIGYLETVQNRNPGGGLSLGNLGPVTEGLWAWVVGIGGLVVIATWIASKGARSK
ncbi:menaquinol-cytochrome c reductase cytochrome c1 subunit precursor [Raineyella antarctica]|uniref:Cytochrome bc1 complex cytochrome c subunit n=1 Tax=Raineyella antarctica TaxID=1577474 RepID=A0A1G6GDP0_9ACTN|nr:c-type cytochrome [Raineyella antarctica]SDB80122.1 menaquinol-cytochrome c reductase cytochrome c1 subunit precursor [Raineyella antarctica]